MFAAGALRTSDLGPFAHHEFFVARTAVVAQVFVDRHIYILARRKFGACGRELGRRVTFRPHWAIMWRLRKNGDAHFHDEIVYCDAREIAWSAAMGDHPDSV